MFGIAVNVRSKVVECTPQRLDEALDSPQVADVCAQIADALEACRRGELSKDEFETLKSSLKKQLPVFTFHATFPHGRRVNADAVPSGLAIYDKDHLDNPHAYWQGIAPRAGQLGIGMKGSGWCSAYRKGFPWSRRRHGWRVSWPTRIMTLV